MAAERKTASKTTASKTAKTSGSGAKSTSSASASASAPDAGDAASKPARAKAKAVAAKGDTPKPTVVTEMQPVSTDQELKKRELVDMVVERTGVKKKFAKPVVEGVIDVLAEAINEGRELNLQPMGKVKYQRAKDTANARILVTKIRQSKSAGPALDPEDRADAGLGAKEGVADTDD